MTKASTKRRNLFKIGLTVFLLVVGLQFSHIAKAASATCPAGYPGCPTQADVSIAGANSQLQAPDSWFEVTVPPTAPSSEKLKITVNLVCSSAGDESISIYLSTITGTSLGSTNYNNPCSSANGSIKSTSVTMNQSMGSVGTDPRYNGQLKTIRVEVVKTVNQQGHVPFEIQVSGDSNAVVSYRGDSDPTSSGALDTQDYPFSVWMVGDHSFPFVPDCDYNYSSQIYLKWADADDGQAGVQPDPLYTELDQTNPQTGVTSDIWHTSDPSVLGTQGVDYQGHSSAITLIQGDTYTWKWENVDPTNAIEVSVPFASNFNGNCNPPTGAIQYVSCNQIRGYAYDPDSGVEGSVYVQLQYSTNNGSTWKDFNPNKAGNTPQGGGAASPNQFYYTNVTDLPGIFAGAPGNKIKIRLQVTDNQSGGVYTVDTGTYTEKSCSPTNTNPDYDASCNITSATGPGGGPILAGDPIYVSATMTNIGNEPLSASELGIWSGDINSQGTGGGLHAYDHTRPPNYVTSYSPGDYGADAWNPGEPGNPGGVPSYYGTIYPGDSANLNTVVVTAPDATAYIVDNTFAHVSGNGINWTHPADTVCTGIFAPNQPQKVYEPFAVSAAPYAVPGAGFTNEDPQQIDYSAAVTVTTQATQNVPVPTSSCFEELPAVYAGQSTACSSPYITPYDGPVSGGTYAPNTQTYTIGTSQGSQVYSPSAAQIAAGNQFCTNIDLGYTYGDIGPDGSIVGTGGANSTPMCVKIVNEPYVHFFGADVSAGGGFGDSCNSKTGGINTFTKTTGYYGGGVAPPVGSGSQLGALSIGPINGFSSALLRSAPPEGSTGLSFSNTTNVSGGTGGDPALGGDLGGSNCVTDYFLDSSNLTPVDNSSISASTASGTNSAVLYQPTGGTLTITGGSIADDSNETIYVNGNVDITSPITFANTSWSNPSDIPSLYIITKGGNIYIQPNVNQLDGMYVSEPDSSGTGGAIDTCANGTSEYNADSLYTACNSQLVVNGAFVADTVYLNRSFGSLRDGLPGEYLSNTTKACGNDGTTALGDCAAEIFNFSPEIYMAQPDLTPTSGPTTGTYDYITSLAPVL